MAAADVIKYILVFIIIAITIGAIWIIFKENLDNIIGGTEQKTGCAGDLDEALYGEGVNGTCSEAQNCISDGLRVIEGRRWLNAGKDPSCEDDEFCCVSIAIG